MSWSKLQPNAVQINNLIILGFKSSKDKKQSKKIVNS